VGSQSTASAHYGGATMADTDFKVYYDFR
jgi:hypothetical protein